MAHHIHVHIHRAPGRTRDAAKPSSDQEALVTALMAAIAAHEKKTRDADFKEEDHPRDHGKFTSGGGSGPSGPKPTSATAKGSKAAVHELLSSGHRFSVDELMRATGCSNKSTLMTALADLKNPKYAGKLGALKIEKHEDGGYHVVKDDGKKEIPIHPDLRAVTRPGAAIHPEPAAVTDPGGTVPGSGKTPTRAEESRMAERAGVPSGPTPPSPKTSPPLYHGGTFSGGKVDGVLYLTPQRSAAESYASATNQRAKVTGSSATSAVKQFKLPEGAKIGTAADVERVAKGLGFNVGPSMSRGQLSAPYLLDKNWMGEQDLKKVTDALHSEGFHGASFDDHDEDHRPHAATAYWGKEDIVPHKGSSEATPELTGTAKLLALQQAAREAASKKKVADPPKQATSKAVHDLHEGTHHVVTLPSGAEHKIQRMDSTGSMGLPGWHVISDPPNGKKGWEAHQPTYMGDTKQEAIQALVEREKRRAPAEKPDDAPSPATDPEGYRAHMQKLREAGNLKDLGNHVVYKRTPQGTRYLSPNGSWLTYVDGAHHVSPEKARELAAKTPGANYRLRKYRDY